MDKSVEKRKFRRFEIPGGKAKHRKIVKPAIIKHFSKSYPVLNLCVGGIAVLCSKEFRSGERVIIQLRAPNENPVNLQSKVRWQDQIALSNDVIVGFEFLEFGNNKGLNSPDALNLLRRLYARYRKE